MTTSSMLYLIAATGIIGIGIFGLFSQRHPVRKLLAVNLLSTAAFLLLIVISGDTLSPPDPLSQALVLTGIVVAVAATAFALALLVRFHMDTGHTDLGEEEPDDGG